MNTSTSCQKIVSFINSSWVLETVLSQAQITIKFNHVGENGDEVDGKTDDKDDGNDNDSWHLMTHVCSEGLQKSFQISTVVKFITALGTD